MNHKHVACTVLGLAIAVMGWATMTMKGKLSLMQAERSQADSAAQNARFSRQAKEAQLGNLKRETEGVRGYLERWQPFFTQTASQEDAEVRLNQLIKQGGLVQINQVYSLTPVDGGSLIKQVVKGDFTFEDDFPACLQWLGSLEQNLPAARVSRCVMTKGQNDNDLKLDVTVEVPLTADDTENAAKS
jgi:hypothetical protein